MLAEALAAAAIAAAEVAEVGAGRLQLLINTSLTDCAEANKEVAEEEEEDA